jgi:hypothetical protein
MQINCHDLIDIQQVVLRNWKNGPGREKMNGKKKK